MQENGEKALLKLEIEKLTEQLYKNRELLLISLYPIFNSAISKDLTHLINIEKELHAKEKKKEIEKLIKIKQKEAKRISNLIILNEIETKKKNIPIELVQNRDIILDQLAKLIKINSDANIDELIIFNLEEYK